MRDDPFLNSRPIQIPLPRSPLVHVLAQIRFPAILTIRSPDEVATFQARLREVYPILEREEIVQVSIGSSGVSPSTEVVWRLSSADRDWRVSLAIGFVALETRRYASRADFLKRLRQIVSATQACFAPGLMTRCGIRYIDRVEGEALDIIDQLVRPEVLGIAASALSSRISHAVSETVLEVELGRLNARWGMLPAHATHDPAAYSPVDRRSWMLDIDVFHENDEVFDDGEIATRVEHMAEHVYALFRWIVTDEFLRFYGGEI